MLVFPSPEVCTSPSRFVPKSAFVLAGGFLLACSDQSAVTDSSSPFEGGAPALAAAGSLVDPDTLIPVPPAGAVSRADGRWTICHTHVSFAPVNEPMVELPCGTVYETSADVRRGIRWYNGENKLEKRQFTRTLAGTWSLSPDGAGPTVTVTGRDNWWSRFAVPGDLTTESGHTAGDGGKVQSLGFGVIGHVAGLVKGENGVDGPHRGVFKVEDDPAVAAGLCAALTR